MSLRPFIRAWRAAKIEPLWQRAVNHVLETPDPIGWNTWIPTRAVFLLSAFQSATEACTPEQTSAWIARQRA